ncbi:hypothetical protein CAAN1_01S04874 [[Candida] anglica]|uniref:Uncharacterized protein n=1 Tax=[Candida] anglica TaxID=148631 RepID=A0ABP0EJK4_9ASCO
MSSKVQPLVALRNIQQQFQLVELNNCDTENLDQIVKVYRNLATILSKYKIKINQLNSDDDFDFFPTLSSLVNQLHYHDEILECKSELLHDIFPMLLLHYLTNPNLFYFIAKKLQDNETLQKILTVLCEGIDPTQERVGILTFWKLYSINKDNRSLLRMHGFSMVYSVVPTLIRSFGIVDNIRTSLINLENQSNELLFQSLKSFLSIESQNSKQLLSILIRNDHALIESLELAISNPNTSEICRKCIIKLFESVTNTLIIHGIEFDQEFDNVLISKIPNENCIKFLIDKDKLQNSISYALECLEHGNDLNFLNLFNISVYYFLSMNNINTSLYDNELNLLETFNKMNTTISFKAFLDSSIYSISKHLLTKVDRNFKSFPKLIQIQYGNFELPPLSKSNYLFDNSWDTDNFNINMKLSNNKYNLNLLLSGLQSCWNLQIQTIGNELKSLSSFKEVPQEMYLNLIVRSVNNSLASLFAFAAIINTNQVDNSIKQSSKILIGDFLEKLITFKIESTNECAMMMCFINFSCSLCQSSLEYLDICDMIIGLVVTHDSPTLQNILKNYIVDVSLRRFVTMLDKEECNFITIRKYLSLPVSNKAPTYLNVSINTFQSFYNEDLNQHKNDKLQPMSNTKRRESEVKQNLKSNQSYDYNSDIYKYREKR